MMSDFEGFARDLARRFVAKSNVWASRCQELTLSHNASSSSSLRFTAGVTTGFAFCMPCSFSMLVVEEFLLSGGPSSSAAVRVVVVHDIKEEESERQKEVHGAKSDEERESEVDEEVGEREREPLGVRMRHGDDDETNEAQT